MVVPIIDSVVNQQARLAVESSYAVLPGSPTWKILSDITMRPAPQFETDPFMGAGNEAPDVMIVNDEFTNIAVTGRLSYTSLMYIFASMFGFPDTTTAPAGTNTKDHAWTWDARRPVGPASYTVHYGIPGRMRAIPGFLFNGFNTGISRGGLDFGSSGFGKSIEPGTALGGTTNEVQTITITGNPTGGTFSFIFRGFTATIPYNSTAAAAQTLIEALPSGGVGGVVVTGGPAPGTPLVVTFTGRNGGIDVPTATFAHALTGGTTPNGSIAATTPGADSGIIVPAAPIFPLHFDVWADDTWAALGTTQLLALYNMGITFGERYARARPVKSNKSSDGTYTNEAQDHTVTLRMGADATADAFLTTVRTGARKFVKVKAVGGATGESTLKYEFEANFCIFLTGTDGYDSEAGIHVMTWNGRIARDSLGNAATFRLRNLQAGL
jgi:hypothetical protein